MEIQENHEQLQWTLPLLRLRELTYMYVAISRRQQGTNPCHSINQQNCSYAALRSPRTYSQGYVIQSECSYEHHRSTGQPIPRGPHGPYQNVKSEKGVSFHSFQTNVSNLSVICLHIMLTIKHAIGYLQPANSYIHRKRCYNQLYVWTQETNATKLNTQHHVF